ncbi:HNH endonuclease signature motif containing protein [Kitasatospora sp. NPDC085879]|uniref:HNH endonuclease n=1 Tax=Kitasatospora sp. NPDC085879 TaxID=3154769 RepID=UPI003433F0A3
MCGQRLPDDYLHSQDVNIDHIRPWGHGGPDTLENIQIAHKTCNLADASSCTGCPGCPEQHGGRHSREQSTTAPGATCPTGQGDSQ